MASLTKSQSLLFLVFCRKKNRKKPSSISKVAIFWHSVEFSKESVHRRIESHRMMRIQFIIGLYVLDWSDTIGMQTRIIFFRNKLTTMSHTGLIVNMHLPSVRERCACASTVRMSFTHEIQANYVYFMWHYNNFFLFIFHIFLFYLQSVRNEYVVIWWPRKMYLSLDWSTREENFFNDYTELDSDI